MAIKIFVSSRLKLEKERKSVREAIKSMGIGFEPILFEDEPASPDHIEIWWKKEINQSDLLILLFDGELSYGVLDEFKTAINYNKKILIFLNNDLDKLELIALENISEDDLNNFTNRLDKYKYGVYKDFEELKQKVKDAISRTVDIKTGLPPNLVMDLISDSNEQMIKIKKVFVEPKEINSAIEILKKQKMLFLSGPASIGKTALAYFLAYKFKKEYPEIERILKVSEHKMSDLKSVKNSLVILDDGFGQTDEYRLYENDIGELLELKQRNYLILTTRKEVFNHKKNKNARLGEYKIDSFILELNPSSSYGDKELEQIYDNHLAYYLQIRTINSEEEEKASVFKDRVVSSLRFPHNIDLFVRDELKNVLEKKLSLEEALENANSIKRTVKLWFKNLQDEERFVAITIALCDGRKIETFKNLLFRIMSSFGQSYEAINSYRFNSIMDKLSSYIFVGGGLVGYIHPTFWIGVIENLPYYTTEISKTFPVLKKLIEENDSVPFYEIEHILRLFLIYNKDKTIAILDKWVKDENLYVRLVVVRLLDLIDRLKPEKLLSYLKLLVSDVYEAVRIESTQVIGWLESIRIEEKLNFLRKQAKDDNKMVKSAVVTSLDALWKYYPEETLEIVEELIPFYQYLEFYASLELIAVDIAKSNPSIFFELAEIWSKAEKVEFNLFAAECLQILGSASADKSFLLLERMGRVNDLKVKLAVIKALGKVGKAYPKKSLSLLIDFIYDAERKNFKEEDVNKIVYHVVNALGEIGKEIKESPELQSIVELMIKLSEKEDYSVRLALGNALGGIGKVHPEIILKTAESAYNSQEERLRFVILVAFSHLENLDNIDRGRVFRILSELSKDDSNFIRKAVVSSLYKLAKFDIGEAKKILNSMKEDTDIEVKRLVERLLSEIELYENLLR